MKRFRKAAVLALAVAVSTACAKQQTETTGGAESSAEEKEIALTEMPDTSSTSTEAETEEETTAPAVDNLEYYKSITKEEFDSFGITVEAQYVDVSKPKDYSGISMDKFYDKTWYSPEADAAIRLYPAGAFIYDPVIEETGDMLYSWDLINRSEQGKCPKLAIYYLGRDAGPLAFYVSHITDDYFYCIEQDYIFYKQPDENEKEHGSGLGGSLSASFNINELNNLETGVEALSGARAARKETDDEAGDEETESDDISSLYMTHASGYDDADDYAGDYADEYMDSGDYEDYDDAYEAAYEDFENYEDY